MPGGRRRHLGRTCSAFCWYVTATYLGWSTTFSKAMRLSKARYDLLLPWYVHNLPDNERWPWDQRSPSSRDVLSGNVHLLLGGVRFRPEGIIVLLVRAVELAEQHFH